MEPERSALQLIGLIYESAGDSSRWPAFLERLREIPSAPTVNLVVQEMPSRQGSIKLTLGSIGLDPPFSRSYMGYCGDSNPAMLRGGPIFHEGQVYRDDELCPRQELYRSEFYNDWIAPQRMSHALFEIVLKAKRLIAFTNLVRYEGAKPLSEDG